MRIGITGHKGKIGKELVNQGGIPIDGDITKANEISKAISEANVDALIHCAAMTDVSMCNSSPELAFKINVKGTNNVLDAFNGLVILISSCHVFSGRTRTVYKEHDRLDPQNYYGYTKQIAEQMGLSYRMTDGRTLIVRTSSVLSFDDINKIRKDIIASNLSIMEATNQKPEITNVIYRSFIYVPHFVQGLYHIIRNIDKYHNSIIHLAGSETITYYQLWTEIAQHIGENPKGIVSRDYELKDEVPRPMFGGLDISNAIQLKTPTYSYIDGIIKWKRDYQLLSHSMTVGN